MMYFIFFMALLFLVVTKIILRNLENSTSKEEDQKRFMNYLDYFNLSKKISFIMGGVSIFFILLNRSQFCFRQPVCFSGECFDSFFLALF